MHEVRCDLEQSKSDALQDMELRLQQFMILAQTAQLENQNLQKALAQKEAMSNKFRADNQSMFADLKALA